MATTEHPARLATSEAASARKATTLLDLHDRLDNLWIKYLRFLDQYTSAQSLLQKHVSDGFLSLARANFNARTGIRRYGKDYFHDRAVASRRTRISNGDEDGRWKLDVLKWNSESEGSDKAALREVEDEDQSGDPSVQQPSSFETPPVELDGNETESKDSPETLKLPQGDPQTNSVTTGEQSSSQKAVSSLDPLRWFGILVPNELRSAQSAFVSGVEDAVTDAANASKRMRELEVEIRKCRKEIRRVEKGTLIG